MLLLASSALRGGRVPCTLYTALPVPAQLASISHSAVSAFNLLRSFGDELATSCTRHAPFSVFFLLTTPKTPAQLACDYLSDRCNSE
jgi:hypothetical protein